MVKEQLDLDVTLNAKEQVTHETCGLFFGDESDPSQ
jgi:hypothetical protein